MYRHWKVKVEILQEGPEPLPRCDNSGMHMKAAQLIKHRRAVICHKEMDMRIRQRDVEMVERYGEMEFSL